MDTHCGFLYFPCCQFGRLTKTEMFIDIWIRGFYTDKWLPMCIFFRGLIETKDWLILSCLTPLSAIFQLYHGDQFSRWKKPEYPERTTDHGQATGKLYHLRMRVEWTLLCNLQSRARTHAVLVIGLYELLSNLTTSLIEPPGPLEQRETTKICN